ncbi:hypothetical protein T484DRAFT_1948092 [Baffinella frigidus]|nr:hypothetical protein T484DRAFT_1948092 [Cryptophyta sp. CCMP2293]
MRSSTVLLLALVASASAFSPPLRPPVLRSSPARHGVCARSRPSCAASRIGMSGKIPGFDDGKQQDEAVLNKAAADGRAVIAKLALENQLEVEQLQMSIDKEISLAMKGAELEMLEEYDAKTSVLLAAMNKDRDVIRGEAARIAELQEQLKQPMWWNKGKKDAGGKDKKSFANAVAPILAWTFGLAAANEIYGASNSDEGITFVVGIKAVIDAFLSVISFFIANRKPKATEQGDSGQEGGSGDSS